MFERLAFEAGFKSCMYFGLTTNSKSQGSIKPFGSFERLQEAIGGAEAQASSQISPIRCLY